jgi:hypothetical protein
MLSFVVLYAAQNRLNPFIYHLRLVLSMSSGKKLINTFDFFLFVGKMSLM